MAKHRNADSEKTEQQAADVKRLLGALEDWPVLKEILGVLEDWSEDSWGKNPPTLRSCREEIGKCSLRVAQIVIKLAEARKQCEMAWLKLFQATDGAEELLREATERETPDDPYQGLDDRLNEHLQAIEELKKNLEKSETRVMWWRTELIRVEARKRLHEFWREYRLIKDEAEAFAFRSGFEYAGRGYSATDLQSLEERIRKINRSLPPGYKPIPNINQQTIMYVPSSIPGQYLPLRDRQYSRQ
jgi:hypothetical protein